MDCCASEHRGRSMSRCVRNASARSTPPLPWCLSSALQSLCTVSGHQTALSWHDTVVLSAFVLFAIVCGCFAQIEIVARGLAFSGPFVLCVQLIFWTASWAERGCSRSEAHMTSSVRIGRRFLKLLRLSTASFYELLCFQAFVLCSGGDSFVEESCSRRTMALLSR